MKLRKLCAIAFLINLVAVPAHAVQPDEVLDDPVLEARARDLGKILRCVVCQNQSIDDSNAPLAKDLRILVRERIQSGDTNEQALNYIVDRYGNFVLLKPPVQFSTLLLWFGPLLIFLLAGFTYWTLIRRKSGTEIAGTAAAPLSDDERRELQDILGKG
jgi:cytochrome c-type biogenesis protein CcmH